MRYFNRILTFSIAIVLAACGTLPIVPPTATAPAPQPTALPSATVTFSVRAPANTSPNSTLAAQVIDEVTGNRNTVILQSAGDNVWTGSTPVTQGEVLRYKYIRTAPTPAEEFTPSRQAVPFRLYIASESNAAVSDIIATWSDAPFAGDQGGIRGAVRNSNTGQGVLGVIVSAAGQVALTAYDGTYTLYNVPSGNQRVTVIAPDGSLRPTQVVAAVPVSDFATVDLNTPDPNAVHVTFNVRLPVDTDPAATVRLIGNVAQMGNTYTLGAGGTAIAVNRAPTLTRQADGRYSGSVLLYEGAFVRYAYTLGDGVWNGELDANGAKTVRSYAVPFTNSSVEDAVTRWNAGPSAPVTFDITVPASTPPYDIVSIQFRTTEWWPPVPMWRTGVNQWKFVLFNPLNYDGSWHYRLCRNLACGAADDDATAADRALSRPFTPSILPGNERQTASAWRFSAEAPVPALSLPPALAHPGFNAGLELPEAWQPNAQPYYSDMLRSAQGMAANSLTVFRRGVATNLAPTVFADSLALSLPPAELRTLTEQAHGAGLKVVLHPVTCAYTPYGPCDYWPAFDGRWNEWFIAYERWMLTQADVAQAAGVDVLVVGDYKLQPALPGEPGAPPEADLRWRDLINRVRGRFNGQLAFEFLMGSDVWPAPPQFIELVDQMRLNWWATLAANNTPNATEMTTAAGGLMDFRLKPLADRFPGKALHLTVAYYSADGAATQCLNRPDGPCHDFRDFNPDAPELPRYGLDLGEQADAYTAVLAAAYTRPWITGIHSAGYNPIVALRDKSLSVRGKSAETVLGAWFLRFQGR